MDESKPGEEVPNVSPFILQAKYGKDEASCRAAGAKAIESLRDYGRYSVLIDLSTDDGTPPFLAEDARKNILAAAFVACKNSGTLLPIQDVATRQDVSLEIALHAGASLIMRYSEPYDEKALWGILIDKRYHDEVRVAAGNAISLHAQKELKFMTLLALVTSPDVPYEIRKPVGLLLIRMAVEQGNYPILLALDSKKNLPIDIRIALEDKVEAAAKTNIELAYAAKDFALLTDISIDARLPKATQDMALGCLHDLMHEKAGSASDAPDLNMAAELMYRIGKGAGIVRSSIEPPPPSDRHILARLKR
ncbi:MAG: hypothetical protein V1861_04025 [Candidatus Micrarchaeota archaeon]